MDRTLKPYHYAGLPNEHGTLQRTEELGPLSPATFDYTPSSRRREKIHSIRFELLTQAGATPRRPRLQILDGATELWRIDCRATQAAFQTRAYNFSPTTRDATAFLANELQTPIPPNFYLAQGFTLRITFTGTAGTDELSNIQIITESWIDG